jgi:hypothetical protein
MSPAPEEPEGPTAPERRTEAKRPLQPAYNRDDEMKPGRPPRTAYEPDGAEGSSRTPKTATDPASGEWRGDPPAPPEAGADETADSEDR